MSNPTAVSSAPNGAAPTSSTTPGSFTPADTTPRIPGIGWVACTDEKVTDTDLDCATVTVPLDYEHPDGGTIDLALVRVPASGDSREGPILFNPGGPGGSGFDYVATGGTAVVRSLGLENFDLIGFDPRGVDRSNGLRCQTDAEIDTYQFLDDTPDTPTEQRLLDEADAAFDKACTAKYGDTLGLYSTDNTARDMDAIRAALGDDTISFLGVSYGTYLGATYATLFPDRVRAMVLDSAYEPTGDSVEEQYTTQLVGFEGAFDNWAAWCQDTADCAFHSGDVAGAWDALLEQLDDNPIANDDGRLGNQAVMGLATIAALYSETEWPVLADALAKASDGAVSGIFALADRYNQRDADGTYNTIGQSNPIISCASGLGSPVPDDPEAMAARLRALAPRFARTITADDFTDGCIGLMPTVTPGNLTYDGDTPILVVGGLNDPATPFRWAEEMTAAMGPSAELVTFTGEGHGQLLSSKCITAIEADLLANLTRPPDGMVCDPDPEVARPDWWDGLPVPDGIDAIFTSPALVGALGLSPSQAFSELRTTTLEPEAAIAAYDEAMAAAGFTVGGTQVPFDGALQGIYLEPNGDVFSVVAVGSDAANSPEMEGIADLYPSDSTLLLLLYLPT